MNGIKAMKIAMQTLLVLKKGSYKNEKMQVVEIAKELQESVRSTVLYTPEILDNMLEQIIPGEARETILEITKETTLEASTRLVNEGYANIACLNFANARVPGGGFLAGGLAQEESLARASGLFPSIVKKKVFYDENKKGRTALYTDHVIYSPNVPVFRRDDGSFLDKPYLLSIITSPAVHSGVIHLLEKYRINQIEPVMKKRIMKILGLAKEEKQDAIILGAFGCGVFKNDVEMVARLFRECLEDERFKNQFEKVVFAIYEGNSNQQYTTFQNEFFPIETVN